MRVKLEAYIGGRVKATLRVDDYWKFEGMGRNVREALGDMFLTGFSLATVPVRLHEIEFELPGGVVIEPYACWPEYFHCDACEGVGRRLRAGGYACLTCNSTGRLDPMTLRPFKQ